jgi:hypothetical protein
MAKSSHPMSQAWRRHTLGVLALLMLGSGAAVHFSGGELGASTTLVAIFVRVGLLLGALWLALPQLVPIFTRFPPWLIVGTVVLGLVVLINPKALAYAVPLMGVLFVIHILGWFTRPFAGEGSKRRGSRSTERKRENGPEADQGRG